MPPARAVPGTTGHGFPSMDAITLSPLGLFLAAGPVGRGVMILLGLAFGLMTDRFLSVQNLTIVASSAAILAIAACAQAIVLITRNLDVSVGSMMGLVAYLTADWAATHPAIWSWNARLCARTSVRTAGEVAPSSP